jgi:hypothetical protein
LVRPVGPVANVEEFVKAYDVFSRRNETGALKVVLTRAAHE